MKVFRKDGKKRKRKKTRKSFSSFSRAANTGNMVKGFCQVQTAPVMSTSQNSDTDGGAELGKLRTGGQAEPAPGLSPGMDIPDR